MTLKTRKKIQKRKQCPSSKCFSREETVVLHLLRSLFHCSKVLIGGHPDGLAGIVHNDFLHFLIDGVDVVALDNGGKVLHKLAL
jgi:hypothetical protein